MKINKLILVTLSVLFLLACNEPEKPKVVEKPRIFPQYNIALDEIIKTNSGVIRGINLNNKADSIRKAESGTPIESEKDHLFFEYKLDSLTNYSIDYTLVNDSLEEISLQINCSDPDVGAKIYADLKDYYEKKLPNPMEDQGQVVYNCFEGQKKPFVVSLMDNSTPVKGIINLLIYKDK
ncbi:MAG: hypothetical protein KA163_09100 [Bacteroidia bacterium]|nr:hypothetical protein [Bacteroidia bacterium]